MTRKSDPTPEPGLKSEPTPHPNPGSDPKGDPDPDPSAERAAERPAGLPAVPCGADGPVFGEPWQATAFALVVALHERGLFEWQEWADRLSRAIAEPDPRDDDPDAGVVYYRQWLRALEGLLSERGIAEPMSLMLLRQAWRVAAETTPHGQPVTLRAASLRWLGE